MQCLHEIVYKFKIFYFIIYYSFLTYIFGILEKVLIYCIIVLFLIIFFNCISTQEVFHFILCILQ